MLKNVLTDIGFTCLTATYDAEKLCTMLCIEKKVDAVYSNDTDNIAMRCPFLLTKHATETKNGKKLRYFEYIQYKYIRKNLKLNRREFLDLCIMCGTDFNNNIPGIGPAKALAYIQKYKKISKKNLIEEFGTQCKYKDFISKYEDSKRIFSKEKSSDCCQDEEIIIGFNIDLVTIRSKLEDNNLGYMTENIVISAEKYKEINNLIWRIFFIKNILIKMERNKFYNHFYLKTLRKIVNWGNDYEIINKLENLYSDIKLSFQILCNSILIKY